MVERSTDGAGAAFPGAIIGWGGVTLLLMLPLVLRAPWTLSDYIIAGIFLGGAGLALEILARVSGSFFYRLGALLAVAAVILLVWVNGAVGFLGDEGNPANLLFAGVIAVAVIGAVVARFPPPEWRGRCSQRQARSFWSA